MVLFLTTWLSWEDFVNLDSSICHRSTRYKYCNTLQNLQTIFSTCTKTKDTKRLVDWLSSKGVSVRTFYYNVHTVSAPTDRSIKYVYTRVKILELGEEISYHLPAILLLFKDSVETIRCSARNVYHFDSVEISDTLGMCPNLTEVDGGGGNAMSDAMIERLVKKCPKLTGLGVGESKTLTDIAFVRNCSSRLPLKRIDFSNSSLTGVSAMSALSSTQGVAEIVPQFERIALAGCRKVSDELALKLSQNGALLTELNISNTEISAVGLRAILTNCLAIDKLNVSNLSGPVFVIAESDEYVTNMNLKWLDVSDTAVCNAGMGIIANCYFCLKHLDAHNCVKVTDVGVLALASVLKDLTYLDLSEVAPRYTYNQTTVPLINNSVAQLIEANPWIETLKLSRRVGSITTLNYALSVSHRQLRVLNLANCFTITDDEVVELTKVSPALRELDLTECSALTDVVLSALSEKCLLLSEINLTGCKGLSLAGMAKFTKTCRKLGKLTH